MNFDFEHLLIFGLGLMVPAAIALGILMTIRLRRGKFHLHRMKRSKKNETAK
jgi:hypothetical protein